MISKIVYRIYINTKYKGENIMNNAKNKFYNIKDFFSDGGIAYIFYGEKELSLIARKKETGIIDDWNNSETAYTYEDYMNITTSCKVKCCKFYLNGIYFMFINLDSTFYLEKNNYEKVGKVYMIGVYNINQI